MMVESLLDNGLLPDMILRFGIRQKLAAQAAKTNGKSPKDIEEFFQSLRETPAIGTHTKEANEQHYEVPTEFFMSSLGARLKYSCCLYETGASNLNEAEEAMLDLYVQRAQIEDGMSILDLGCGWGSCTLYLAERFPNCTITSISNSATQKEFIDSVAKEKGFKNITVITADITQFNGLQQQFDRIISIEMFEHMKNYKELLAKVSNWLKPETGRLFIHVFSHKHAPYHFENGPQDWMGRYFFSGGTMPNNDLFYAFQDDVTVLDRWTVNGKNYGQTSEDWLLLMDNNKEKIMPSFIECYGKDAYAWWNRWRIFYIAVAETFNYDDGNEWMVSQYLFKRK